jgi:hypothetical protein
VQHLGLLASVSTCSTSCVFVWDCSKTHTRPLSIEPRWTRLGEKMQKRISLNRRGFEPLLFRTSDSLITQVCALAEDLHQLFTAWLPKAGALTTRPSVRAPSNRLRYYIHLHVKQQSADAVAMSNDSSEDHCWFRGDFLCVTANASSKEQGFEPSLDSLLLLLVFVTY